MSPRLVLTFKLLTVGVFVMAAISFMVQLLWPFADAMTLVIYTLAGWGLLSLLALLGVGCVIVSASIWQWILRHRGTDTQWLWFPGEPQGLARQRQSQRLHQPD